MIFNKDTNGAAELKALLGFIYKSNNFENIISFISFAERDIRKVVGDAVFVVAENHYKSDHFNCDESDIHPEYTLLDLLVSHIQLPVALHAYRRYAPQNDVGHSDSGRFITVTEQEKPAFEWMIDKSDNSLLELANESVDLLLEFLDENEAEMSGDPTPVPLIPWAASDEYKAAHELFISKKEFDKEYSIGNSYRTFLALAPFIKKVQENEIQACIGKAKYDDLAASILSDDLSEAQKLLLCAIFPALVFLSLSRAIVRISIEILPNGLFSNFLSSNAGKRPASLPERLQVSQHLLEFGNKELSKLQLFINRLLLEESGGTFEVYDPLSHIEETDKIIHF